MKRNIVTTTLVIVCSTMLSLAATAQTGDAACSLAGVAGTYGFSDSGTVVTLNELRAATGIFTLDASGKLLNGNATQSLNGVVNPETFSGSYTANPDCTGSFAITITITDSTGKPTGEVLDVTGFFAWDDNMNQTRFIFTSVSANGASLATVINGEGRKLGTQNAQ